MRRSADPLDPGFVGDDYPGCFVRLDGGVFDRGRIITVDSVQGVIVYVPIDKGGLYWGAPLMQAKGKVEIYDLPHGARPN